MKRDLIYLHHILECVEKVEKATKKKTKKSFENSGILKDGVLYNLQIMSESTQKISKSLKLDAPEIPWSNISGFRNKLVHDYMGIDLDVIWNVVKKELPKLKKRVIKIIKNIKKYDTKF